MAAATSQWQSQTPPGLDTGEKERKTKVPSFFYWTCLETHSATFASSTVLLLNLRRSRPQVKALLLRG